ncbi:MAG: hypothetical protein K5786_09850 [Treponema sp.]|nr:hypothetical protein [Treponema sp.]
MKKNYFSRLFAAFAFVAVLVLSGCVQNTAEAPESIIGSWVSSYGEQFDFTADTVAETAYGMWAIDIEDIEEVSESSGVIYGILTKGSTYTPVDTYYAVAYKDLTASSVKIAAAATSYETLDEVKESCTIDNMFTYYSECTKK